MARCEVCGEDSPAIMRNDGGHTVCQPSILYMRAMARAGQSATLEQMGERYRVAMQGHGLLVRREEPRAPGERTLPCGWEPRQASAAS